MQETKGHQPSDVAPEEPEELELTHTDKLVGIFTEPSKTFSMISAEGAKTSDWLIPLLILILTAILSNILMMSNPVIKSSIIEKQMKQLEKNLDEAVAKGQITESQKEEQLENIRERMEKGGLVYTVFNIIGIIVFSFLVFFIVSGVLLLFVKLILKGEGTYKDAMTAYGLPYYISVIQIIIMVILALISDKMFTSTSFAEFIEVDRASIAYFILKKLDPFSIWFYSTVSIGFAKMFKSSNTWKYFVLIFSIWIGFGLIFFLLAKVIPFLSAFSA
ncbi:MAG: YIP1 family protein [Melioribacter sp.]|nr:YIP1 family protein [Melioribacter sp.]